MVKLQGRITLDGTDPATGAVVEILNGQGDVVDQAQVDSDGRYGYHLSEGTWGPQSMGLKRSPRSARGIEEHDHRRNYEPPHV